MSITELPVETPVLIVGAGPAGLILALSLLQNGIKVRIIEKLACMFKGQRGAGMMPRAMELYRTLGLLPDILKAAIPFPRVLDCEVGKGIGSEAPFLSGLPQAQPTPDFPYLNALLLGQGRAQRIIEEHIRHYGCEVEYSTEMKVFEQYDDHIIAHLVKTQGGVEVKEDVRARYMIGADGGKGAVRKMLGLPFLGETRSGEHWVISDCSVNGVNFNKELWHMWGNFERGFVTIRPTDTRNEDNSWWIAIGGRHIDYANLTASQEEFVKFVHEVTGLPEMEITDFTTQTHVVVNVRMVDRMQVGRVFLVGGDFDWNLVVSKLTSELDAAHIHSFTGAQGMNSGVQDAFNLAWKLAAVLKGVSPPSILETYGKERLPIIKEVLRRSTTMLDKTVTNLHAAKEIGNTWLKGREFFQLDHTYRGSSIVIDELNPEVQVRVTAGDRAPDSPGLTSMSSETKAEVKSLFDYWVPTKHTALVFPSSSHSETEIYLSALAKFPVNTVQTLVILPQYSTPSAYKEAVHDANVKVVVDSENYAWTIYPTMHGHGAKVVIVRPDGSVGAVAQSAEGVEKYRDLVFGA